MTNTEPATDRASICGPRDRGVFVIELAGELDLTSRDEFDRALAGPRRATSGGS